MSNTAAFAAENYKSLSQTATKPSQSSGMREPAAVADVGHRHSEYERKLQVITGNDKHQLFCNHTSSTFPALGFSTRLLEVLIHSLALQQQVLLPGNPSAV